MDQTNSVISKWYKKITISRSFKEQVKTFIDVCSKYKIPLRKKGNIKRFWQDRYKWIKGTHK